MAVVEEKARLPLVLTFKVSFFFNRHGLRINVE